jgi:C-terminal processing protease CtpA/Prc
VPRRLLLLAPLLAGCVAALPDAPPPLADMEEPPALFAEPDDEAARQGLPLGCYTGIVVTDPRRTLEERLAGDTTEGVLVAEVTANSPGDAAGIVAGDVLLEAHIGGVVHVLGAPSAWRRLEQEGTPGTVVTVRLDRAGAARQTQVTWAPRVRRDERQAVVRLREEDKVGVVLRSATEVEARVVGLGPGGGAVIVGLSRGSPWRTVGLHLGDLIVRIGTHAVDHPQRVLEAIRNASGATLVVEFVRSGERRTVAAPLSARAGELREVGIPLLFTHSSDRGTTTTSMLLGLIHYRSTAAAWRVRLLWLLSFGGGDADRLLEVGK